MPLTSDYDADDERRNGIEADRRRDTAIRQWLVDLLIAVLFVIAVSLLVKP